MAIDRVQRAGAGREASEVTTTFADTMSFRFRMPGDETETVPPEALDLARRQHAMAAPASPEPAPPSGGSAGDIAGLSGAMILKALQRLFTPKDGG